MDLFGLFCKQEEKLLFFGSVSGCTCLIWIRVVSPRKVSRFAPHNGYYIIIDEVFFDNFWVIIYLLVVCKKKNNSFISVYFNYLFISCIQKIIIIHSFWFTFVKDLKRNFSFKIYKKPHKSSKKFFFLYQRKGAWND